MIPLLPATCPPPAKPRRFARYQRGEHLRRELLPGPIMPLPGTVQPLALPAPAQSVAPESLFSYDNSKWRQVAPAPRRACLLAVENLMDQLALYLNGELTETQFDAATRSFRTTIFTVAPTPVMEPKLRREPAPLRGQGNLPWTRQQRPVITRPAAMSDEGKALLALLEHGPATEPFKSKADDIDAKVDELNKAAWDAGRKKADEVYKQMMANRQNRMH
jgi:hypothetical protein